MVFIAFSQFCFALATIVWKSFASHRIFSFAKNSLLVHFMLRNLLATQVKCYISRPESRPLTWT